MGRRDTRGSNFTWRLWRVTKAIARHLVELGKPRDPTLLRDGLIGETPLSGTSLICAQGLVYPRWRAATSAHKGVVSACTDYNSWRAYTQHAWLGNRTRAVLVERLEPAVTMQPRRTSSAAMRCAGELRSKAHPVILFPRRARGEPITAFDGGRCPANDKARYSVPAQSAILGRPSQTVYIIRFRGLTECTTIPP